MPQNRFWNLLSKKLAGEAVEEELAELEELMRLHPEWQYAAQHIEDLWKLVPKDTIHNSEYAFEQLLAKIPEEERTLLSDEPEKKRPFFLKRYTWVPWLAAASVVGIIGMVILNSGKINNPNYFTANKISEVSTRFGSKSKLVLPDGSTVWLNAGSKLTYNKDFGVNNRTVNLEGEAFFDVVKMPEAPFIIQTKAIQIKVVGTAFNVKSYADESTTETSLIRGKVEITLNARPGEKFILHPNEKFIVANNLPASLSATKENKRTSLMRIDQLTFSDKDSTVIETSWIDNKLAFQDESFAEIAKKMERWYNVEIEFLNPELEKERMTGTFENESIVQALQALQISTDFHFTIDQNKIAITK